MFIPYFSKCFAAGVNLTENGHEFGPGILAEAQPGGAAVFDLVLDAGLLSFGQFFGLETWPEPGTVEGVVQSPAFAPGEFFEYEAHLSEVIV